MDMSSFKQARVGYLRKFENSHYLNLLGPTLASVNSTPTIYDKSIFTFRFRHIPEKLWIKSLSNIPVEAKPQLAQ